MHPGIPGKCPYRATIIWQLDGPVHQDVDPAPCDGRTDSQEDACDAETESNRAWSALEEVSNSRLNMQVSNVLYSSFWETRDAERRE